MAEGREMIDLNLTKKDFERSKRSINKSSKKDFGINIDFL